MSKHLIIPAAGKGTRFLPFSQYVPKELVPLFEKPALHYILEEAAASNHHKITLVINKEKEILKDVCLEQRMCAHHAMHSFKQLISQLVFSFSYQEEARGLGHAILTATSNVQIAPNAFYSVILPDELIFSSIPALEQLYHHAEQMNATVIGVKKIDRSQAPAYGMIKIKRELSSNFFEVDQLVEKPLASQAPSEYAIIGRYVLKHTVFDRLQEISSHHVGSSEIQLTTALDHDVQAGNKIYAFIIDGDRFDVGTPANWFNALLHIAEKSSTYTNVLQHYFSKDAPHIRDKKVLHTSP
jgi:UTP--glucose-1-phosphate uridylyltransferase